eukprot:TRINITY_DN6654_c0_g1_i2.p1 TRINITY_DN6654_c0_g1~~TRINITY_DN6654_c0_g1_i2.p1  ORF type:complete len:110 (+),score=10.49 TRINITY_DN6654_c0_g1_i2:76-405(+)
MSYGSYGSGSSSYGSSSSSSSFGNDYDSGAGSMSAGQRSQVMSQVQQQVQMSQFTELLQKMSHACFEKCVPKPGSSLSSSEQVHSTICTIEQTRRSCRCTVGLHYKMRR